MADNENPNVENIEPVETAAEEREPDEEFETIPVGDLLDVKLGRQGENDTQTVVIDCSAWLTQLPGCQLMIAATRPGEREIYLPEVSVSNGVVTWPILEQDTACAGTSRAEVRAMKNDKVKKSALFRTRIEPALEGDGSPDAPTPPNWVKLIIDSVEEAQASVERSEALVDEATATAIYAVRFDVEQGLTETQKATARGNIGAVKISVEGTALVIESSESGDNFYNQWAWSSAAGGTAKLTRLLCTTHDENGIIKMWDTDGNERRRSFGVLRGVTPMKSRATGEDTEYYPVPIPAGATRARAVLSDQSQYLCIYVLKPIGNGLYELIAPAQIGWHQGTDALAFTAGEGLVLYFNCKYDNAGSAYPSGSDPDVTLTFE